LLDSCFLMEKVVVSLNEEENASVHGNNAASKLAAVEREIAELKDYYLELQYEQKQWNELLDEKQRDVEKASRDNGPKELSSHRFARIRRSYLGDLGALHTVEGSIVNFVRKVEKNFPKNANIEVLRKDIEVAEAELAKLEAKAVTYLELLNEMSEEDMLGQIAECEQQMENARQWFRDRGLMDKFNSIVKQNIESVHSCGVTVQSRSFQ
uniref:Uncharacterized protein n=1 Tax=Parascaris univalens TaxID=6257 RepID=A0A915C0F3_PARUN